MEASVIMPKVAVLLKWQKKKQVHVTCANLAKDEGSDEWAIIL